VKRWIRISTLSGGILGSEVDAEITGQLAYHPTPRCLAALPGIVLDPVPGSWNVTHVKSGCCVATVSAEEEAQRVALALEREDGPGIGSDGVGGTRGDSLRAAVEAAGAMPQFAVDLRRPDYDEAYSPPSGVGQED